MRGLITLKDYLGKSHLNDHLQLTKSISFHWSNWDKTCFVQQQYYKNYNNNFHLTELNNTLLDLKTVPIWLCNRVEVVRTDLYSLYESYLDSRLRLTWLERKDELLFSTDSEQGPFYTLTSMKWFNKSTYAKFVMRKILLEQFTLRSFRLNTSIPTILKFDNDVTLHHHNMSIHQLSESGIILKIKDKNFINKIKNSTHLELKIPVQCFYKTERLNFHDSWKKLDSLEINSDENNRTYQLQSKIMDYYGNNANAKRSGDNEFYIFARYEDFLQSGHNISLSEAFAPLVSKTKKYFAKELEVITEEKQVA